MKQAGSVEKLIKRYDNRKLYDPEARRYVTLNDVARMLAEGVEVKVVDQKTGEDLTTTVLAQVLLEGLKERSASIPRHVLARLIRLGLRPAAAWADWSVPQEAAARTKAEVERVVSGLLSRGKLSLDEALALRQELGSAVHRIVTEAQHGIEARVRSLLDRSEKESGIHPALNTLRERLLSFETYLEPPSGPRRRAPRPRR